MKNVFAQFGMTIGGLVVGLVGFSLPASAHGGGGHHGHSGGGMWVCTASDSYTYSTGSGPSQGIAESQALAMCQTSANGSQHGGVCRVMDCVPPEKQ